MGNLSHIDVSLVSMPVTFLAPSPALGLLKTELTEEGISSKSIYSSLRFISFLGAKRYHEAVGLMRRIHMGWEILFAKVAGFSPSFGIEDLLDLAEKEVSVELSVQGKDGQDDGVLQLREVWKSLEEAAEKFVEQEADYILSMNPKIVGIAILTQQRNSSFALMRKIKEKAPNVITIIGGTSTAGDMGLEFLRKIPSLDYVFSGEADGVFADVCKLLLAGDTENLRKNHPEVLMRGASSYVRVAEDVNDCRYPDYDDYFEEIKRLYAIDGIDGVEDDARYLVLESSRGCWYGQYQRCRFCGLHFSKNLINYRDKTPERFFEEAEALAKKYDCYDIYLCDNALSKKLIASLPDNPSETRRKLNMVAECRATMKREDIRKLKLNGFTALQPGIESLSDECLQLMNKGATVTDNLAFLKNARIFGMRAIWNIIHSFPGEKAEWYEEMLTLLKHIHHFEPPYNILKLLLARDSLFVEKAEEFGLNPLVLAPMDYAMNPNDEEFIRKTALYYQSPNIIPNVDMIYRINKEVSKWLKDFLNGAHLIRVETPAFTVVKDARDLNDVKTYRFTGVKKEIMSYADEPISEFNLRKNLGYKYGDDEIETALRELRELFIIYRKKARVLSLATPKNCAGYRQNKKMVTL